MIIKQIRIKEITFHKLFNIIREGVEKNDENNFCFANKL